MKRALIAAGGTGGHFYPGLVLGQALKERGWEPLFLVREADPALARLESLDLPACPVPLTGLPRRPGLALLGYPARLARSLGLVRRIVRDFRPAVVIGMGGYLSFPAVAAAALAGVPRALHESNAILGLANKAGAALGAALFWGLPPARGGELLGTPIRPALWSRADSASARRELGLEPGGPALLVFGGSQGARGLNLQAPGAIAAAARGRPVQVLHLAGAASTEEVAAAYAAAGLPAKVLPYLERMELAFAAAELVVCRSGASTLAELAAQRRAAVLVPFPSAAANHQELNARAVERAGAAVVALERELPGRLAGSLDDLLFSERAPERRAAMESAWDGLGLPPAEQVPARLADAVERLAGGA